MPTSTREHTPSLRTIYQRLFRAMGPQGWWPAESPFETMVGAILTQATNWHNVEQAIERLREANALQPQRLATLARPRLERLIHPAGYFRQKAKRLTGFARWYVRRYGGDPARMFRTPWRRLRRELLMRPGIGPETADTMLLYAGNQPVAVIDAYTRRILRRHRLLQGDESYDAAQRLVMDRFAPHPARYNEFHALLVEAGKRFCHRRNPRCEECPLGDLPRTLEVTNNGSR